MKGLEYLMIRCPSGGVRRLGRRSWGRGVIRWVSKGEEDEGHEIGGGYKVSLLDCP
jgi:hypothetical protein